MKNLFLVSIILCSFELFAQDSLRSTKLKMQIFSLSPIAKNVSKVNGVVLGVGLYDNQFIAKQTINGINLEANPIGLLAPFFLFIPLDKKADLYTAFEKDTSTLFKINGINLSSGGFISRAELNGINVSTFTKINVMNGISVSGFGIGTAKSNGISIAGFWNYSQKCNGMSLAIVNNAIDFNGLQIGFFNDCSNQMRGLQIGLVNVSKHTKGLQLGLLNINKKRALPFINF